MTTGAETDRIAELEEDNKRLRRLLDQRDAPGELRHRLRNTLGLLRAVVRKSANTGRDLADYVDHLEDRLDAVMRAQALADQHGEADLRMLVADELFAYGASEGERLLLSGPEVRLQPKAAQSMALAIHELAVNAVEHGALGTDKGRIEMSWHVAPEEPGTPLSLLWTEFNPEPSAEPVRRGFGTEVISRMLPYELKAKTDLAFGSSGLRCTIRLPLHDKVGRVV